METQLDLRRDLGVIRVAHGRQSTGPEQDRVRLLTQADGRLRHRLAGLAVMVGAGRRFGEAEREIRLRLDLAQNFQGRRHHLGADAIAGEHGDVERVVGGHELPRGAGESVIASEAKQSIEPH